jgi:hypothetical protein
LVDVEVETRAVEGDDGKFGHQNYFRSSGGWADFLPTIRRVSQHWEIRDSLADRAFGRRLQSVIRYVAKRPVVPQWNNGPRSNGTSCISAKNVQRFWDNDMRKTKT